MGVRVPRRPAVVRAGHDRRRARLRRQLGRQGLSLNAATGCVHWYFDAGAGVRSAISVGRIDVGRTRYAAFFGDAQANVYALDAATGR